MHNIIIHDRKNIIQARPPSPTCLVLGRGGGQPPPSPRPSWVPTPLSKDLYIASYCDSQDYSQLVGKLTCTESLRRDPNEMGG